MSFGGGGYGSYQSMDPYGGSGGGGGGGYGGGGGGFVQGSQGFSSSPGGIESSPSGGRGRNKPQAIKVMTSAQLLTVEDTGENIFKVDGKDIGMVALVGEVMEIKENPTSIVYMIDDRTGPLVKVQRWIEDQSSPMDPSERSLCREGMYVKAIGNIKTFNNQKTITAFSVRPVTDFNEVTYHLSDAMMSHLAATRALPVPEQFKGLQSTPGLGTPMATSTQMGSSGGGGVYGGAQQQHDSGLNAVQQQTLRMISGCHNDQGININELIRNMKQQGHGEMPIRNSVDFLCNEGHIYSTVDDDHYKSTDA